MPELARITAIGEQQPYSQPEKPSTDGVARLADEPVLWYRRYTIYRELGHKRSLRAAVAKERETIRLLKEPEPAPKSTVQQKKSGQKAEQGPVAQEKNIQVPGSWKAACKAWRWTERAQRFDEWRLEQLAQGNYERFGNSLGNKYLRVKLLQQLVDGAVLQMNTAAKNGTTHKVYLSYLKQIADLLKQIESEMSHFTEEETKGAILASLRGKRDAIDAAYSELKK